MAQASVVCLGLDRGPWNRRYGVQIHAPQSPVFLRQRGLQLAYHQTNGSGRDMPQKPVAATITEGGIGQGKEDGIRLKMLNTPAAWQLENCGKVALHAISRTHGLVRFV